MLLFSLCLRYMSLVESLFLGYPVGCFLGFSPLIQCGFHNCFSESTVFDLEAVNKSS